MFKHLKNWLWKNLIKNTRIPCCRNSVWDASQSRPQMKSAVTYPFHALPLLALRFLNYRAAIAGNSTELQCNPLKKKIRFQHASLMILELLKSSLWIPGNSSTLWFLFSWYFSIYGLSRNQTSWSFPNSNITS